jgi:hypothetical protein
MRYIRPRRPSLPGLVAAIALVIACVSVTGSLAAGKASNNDVVGLSAVIRPGALVSVPSNSIETATETCPGGREILSGGYEESGSVTLNVVASHGDNVGGANPFKGWEVQVVNPPLGQPGEIRAIAYCYKFVYG